MRHFAAQVKDGKLSVDRKLVDNMLKHTSDGNYLMVLISMDSERDEREWQKYYRVLLKQMSEDTGHSAVEMHEMAKADVLVPKMGLSSTTELDSVGWKEYVEHHLAEWSLESFDFVI